MSGKLRMYNVKFGDSFLLYGQGENLLVDLGSIQRDFCFDSIRDSIRAESENGQLSLRLSHFHKDHWSGLYHQAAGHSLPALKTVYLPNIFCMRISLRLDVIVSSLLEDFLEAIVLQRRPYFTLADLLREVLPGLPKERICFLSRGDTFQMGGKSYEVLWPSSNPKDLMAGQSKQLYLFLGDAEARLAAGGAEVGLWDTMESLANVLLRDFASFSEYQPLSPFVLAEENSYETLYRRAENLLDILINELRQDKGEFRKKVRHYINYLHKDRNRVSLVFQEQTEEQDEDEEHGGVLMTGDITKPIMTLLAHGDRGAPRLKQYYSVIKAPHHGTETHFCAILPHSKFFCISNGEGNSHCRRITELYEYVYGDLGKKSVCRCTNPRCDFRKRKNYCPYFNTHPKQKFYDISW